MLDLVHVPSPAAVTGVPSGSVPLKTWTLAPGSAVPESLVAPTQIGELTVGLAVCATAAASYAPMSSCAPPTPLPSSGRGKLTPRWSWSGAKVSDARSMAVLPVRRARVSVGPPLFWSGPSSALAGTAGGAALAPVALKEAAGRPAIEVVCAVDDRSAAVRRVVRDDRVAKRQSPAGAHEADAGAAVLWLTVTFVSEGSSEVMRRPAPEGEVLS